MTDVVKTEDSEVFKRFLAAADDAVSEADADEISLEIIGRILQAETVDDILGGSDATHAKDFLNTPFVLRAVKFNQSTHEGAGPKFYAVLEGTTPGDGDEVVITCGAHKVIAQAWRLQDIGALPLVLIIDQAKKPTGNGFYPMWLAKPDDF